VLLVPLVSKAAVSASLDLPLTIWSVTTAWEGSAINQLYRCSNEGSSTINHGLMAQAEFSPYFHTANVNE
jgi:hypothetical protein